MTASVVCTIGCPVCDATGLLDNSAPDHIGRDATCPLCRGTGETTDLAFENYDLRQQVYELRARVLRLTAELTFDRAVLSRLPAAGRGGGEGGRAGVGGEEGGGLVMACSKPRTADVPTLSEPNAVQYLAANHHYMFQLLPLSQSRTMVFIREKGAAPKLIPAVCVKLVVPIESDLGGQMVASYDAKKTKKTNARAAKEGR